MNTRVGTSGWAYRDWGKRFYPARLSSGERLSFLAQHFNTVEINTSFYRLPSADMFSTWAAATPDDFVFAVKVSRLITHNHRLHDVAEAWATFRSQAAHLGAKLAVYLLQFPPSFAATPEHISRLEEFASGSYEAPLALELRHASWFTPANLDILGRTGACLVHADASPFPHTPRGLETGPISYYRLHGPRELYASSYTEDELQDWATQIRQTGRPTFTYFDNDVNGYALDNAQRLAEMLQGDPPNPVR
jgi:uncharacterized protein YecE (DUF72 family)